MIKSLIWRFIITLFIPDLPIYGISLQKFTRRTKLFPLLNKSPIWRFSSPDLPVYPQVEVHQRDGGEEPQREEVFPPALVADEELVSDQGGVWFNVAARIKKRENIYSSSKLFPQKTALKPKQFSSELSIFSHLYIISLKKPFLNVAAEKKERKR